SYDFTAEEGDRPDRFLLSFENSENRRPPGGRTTVTASGNSIVLHIAGETRAEVFSLSGERLRDSRFLTPGTADLVADAPAGWYFVRLTTGGRSSVTRVFLSTNR
ncbi:MAG TPA: T9SS type A sorting domain-containing protein, partial [Bacteroidales bacterium]|nr:T9SS type A sorting domain-containing protein [Bacteroidales bacterium]